MKRYKVCYNTTDGDYSKCWVEASSREDAIRQVYDEYWDVKDIISVSLL